MNLYRHSILLSAICLMSVGAAPLSAQEYPSGPVTIVVPFSASGSPPNVLARTLAERLQARWDQPVVVENRPGAAGQVAVEYVVNQPADGTTLFLGSVATTVLGPIMRNMETDPMEALVPISLFGYTPMLVSASADSGITSLEQLVAEATDRPGELTYMSVGVGSAAHLAAELLQSIASIELIHVPYDGVSQATLDLVSGEINIGFSNIISMVQFIEEGQVVPLAVTDSAPSPVLPETPAIADTYPEATVELWWGLFGPTGMPQEAIDELATEVAEMVQDAELVEDFQQGGATLRSTTPAGLQEIIDADFQKWSTVVESAGIR